MRKAAASRCRPSLRGSTLFHDVRVRAYPVIERSGILFAFLGDGEPTCFPEFDCFVAPDSHTFAFKGLIECNWLQALESASIRRTLRFSIGFSKTRTRRRATASSFAAPRPIPTCR